MYKWEYAKGQRAPRPVLTTNRTDGPAPLTVQFSSEGTADPDPADSIVIEWDFGDGTTSNDPNPTHTYTNPGRYTAVLRVTDSSGRTAATSTIITAGNTSPAITIDLPVEGGTFAFGESIPYKVTVTDPEDGTVNCDDVLVTFVLGHDEHGHAEDSQQGCSGTLTTLADDVSHGGNVFGVINVRYTDRGGSNGVPALTTIAETKIRQRKQQVEHALNQSGTNLGTNTDEGSGQHRGSLAAGDWIELNGPFNLQGIQSLTFRVADSADGRTPGSPLAAVELRTGSQTGPIVATYDLTSTGGTATWSSQTFPISLSGTNRLFLVFRAVRAGRPATTSSC
jgi:PKD repeat protein